MKKNHMYDHNNGARVIYDAKMLISLNKIKL